MSRSGKRSTEQASIRVLIADDHAMVREGFRAVLSLDGDIEVVGEASDGAEAVRLTEELTPQVVLMDIAMPGMDGIEATRTLREVAPDTRVVIVTGQTDERQALPAIRAGAVAYVLKTTAGDELRAAVRAAAQGRMFLDPSVADYVIQAVAREPRRDAPAEGPEALTEREWEVLELVARGHTSREVAEKLFIGAKTVETHRERVMLKLNLKTRAELVQFAIGRGLLEQGE